MNQASPSHERGAGHGGGSLVKGPYSLHALTYHRNRHVLVPASRMCAKIADSLGSECRLTICESACTPDTCPDPCKAAAAVWRDCHSATALLLSDRSPWRGVQGSESCCAACASAATCCVTCRGREVSCVVAIAWVRLISSALFSADVWGAGCPEGKRAGEPVPAM